MDGNIYRSDTKGAYQVCAVCYKGLLGESWQWTEQPRQYFCGPEHAKLYADCKGDIPDQTDRTIESIERPEQDGAEKRRPGILKRTLKWWQDRSEDGDSESR